MQHRHINPIQRCWTSSSKPLLSTVVKISLISLLLTIMSGFDVVFFAMADEFSNTEVVCTVTADGEYVCKASITDSQTEKTDKGIHTKCGFKSTERFLSRDNFQTWFEVPSTGTNSPIMFPLDDQELAYIVTTAKANGCKVRVRGSGHSEDGIVMQKLDELDMDVVVINLKDYVLQDSSWNCVIDPTKPSIKISAGASMLRLLSLIRPEGYLTTTNTAGRFFSVGGAYLNPSVHGAGYGESRYAAQVLSVRVMNADGHIAEYSGDDVKVFRGSMGLLGIVTALEIQIREDNGLKMEYESWPNMEEDIRTFFQRKLSLSDNDGTEFFYWVYEDVVDTFSIDLDGNPDLKPDSTISAWYKDRLEELPDLAYSGGAIATWISDNTEGKKVPAALFAKIGRRSAIKQHKDAAIVPRDGYFVDGSNIPKFEQIQYSVKCASNCLDEMIELFVTTRDFLIEKTKEKSSGWYPSLPLEWRVFEVKEDEMVLEHLSKGTYLSWENVAFLVEGEFTYSKFYKRLEDLWRDKFPDGGIHHGKAYAYGPVAGVGDAGEEFPFQNNTILEAVYSPDVRKQFIEKMDLYDPSQTFRAGSVLHLLGLTNKKYTPKRYIGGSCKDFGSNQCINSCCCNRLQCGLDLNKCVAAKTLNKGDFCDVDCQCKVSKKGNACRKRFGSIIEVEKCRD